MKKIIILTLCATSFLLANNVNEAKSLAQQKKQCVTFADTAGEGCLVIDYYKNGDIFEIYEIKDEKVKKVVDCDYMSPSGNPYRCRIFK